MKNTFRFSLSLMCHLLQILDKGHSTDWAHEMCRASRLIHSDIWAGRFSPKLVKGKIMKLFRDALSAVSELQTNGLEEKDIALINSYKNNINDRLKNIKDRYLEGKPSAFLPEDKLRELRNKAFANRGKLRSLSTRIFENSIISNR